MVKPLIAGTAMLALLAGVARAQSSTSETITTQSTAAPAAGSYSATQSRKTIDANGVEIDRNRSHSSGAGGTTDSANMQVTAPDGTKVTTAHSERTARPTNIITRKRTTTTSTGQ